VIALPDAADESLVKAGRTGEHLGLHAASGRWRPLAPGARRAGMSLSAIALAGLSRNSWRV
jgi:hypothetical protein